MKRLRSARSWNWCARRAAPYPGCSGAGRAERLPPLGGVGCFPSRGRRRFSGFGISVVLVPLLLLVYDQPTVVALNAVLSAAIVAAVARDSWREADRSAVIALLILAFPGLAVGAQAL